MILSFHPCFDTDFQIILGDRNLNEKDLEKVKKAKAVILPQGCKSSLYEKVTETGVLTFPNYDVRFKYQGKIGQNSLFEEFNCPHPETLCWSTVDNYLNTHPDLDSSPHTIPFIMKDDKSHEAHGVFLVKDNASLKQGLDFISLREKTGFNGFVTQEYISSAGNALRAVIIGEKILTYWKRPKDQDQVITTIAKGALIDYNWRPDLQQKGKELARILTEKSGINLAAVDFVFPLTKRNPEPHILEINYFFGRRGLGGVEKYYNLVFEAIKEWLVNAGLNPKLVRLV